MSSILLLHVNYNHKRVKSENSFSFFGSAVIIYPKVFAPRCFWVYNLKGLILRESNF